MQRSRPWEDQHAGSAAAKGAPMSENTHRILTTHTGSLPRPDDLIQMMWAHGDGIPVDERPRSPTGSPRGDRVGAAPGRCRRRDRQRRRDVEAQLRHLREGPLARVRRRVGPGLLLPGPRRLPAERGGRCRQPRTAEAVAPGLHRADLRAGRRRGRPGPRQPGPRRCPRRTGRWPGRSPARRRRAWCRCSSPTSSTPTTSSTSRRSPRRCAPSTRPSPRPGSRSSSTVRIWRWVGTPPTPRMDQAAFRARVALEHRGAQPRRPEHPCRSPSDASLLGQLPGPAPPRRRPGRDHRPRLAGEAADRALRGGQPPPRPRVEALRDDRRAGRQDPLPRASSSPSRTTSSIPSWWPSGSSATPEIVGRDRVMAGVDCGFSVHVGIQGVDPDVVWAKLRSLARGRRDRDGATLAVKR